MKKILVIDDDDMNRDILVRRLEKSGFNVEIAKSGEDGVEMVKATPIDLVLLDVRMTGMDGWQTAREIRKMKGTSLRIIAFSASGGATDRKASVQAGCDEFIAKPFVFDELIARIEELINTAA